MPKFSSRSRRALASAHKDLRLVFNTVIEQFDVTVLEGIRGKDRQNRLYEEGKSQVQWPNSAHNVRAVPHPPRDGSTLKEENKSLAVDVVPYPIDWDDTERFKHLGFYVLGLADALYSWGAIDHRIRWGADWDRDLTPVDRDPDESFFDSPHYELIMNG